MMGDLAAVLKKLKTGGIFNILPEMIKVACCREALLLDLVHTGRRRGCLGTGQMLCLFPYPRKEISAGVTTGEALHCWMWWVGWLPGQITTTC